MDEIIDGVEVDKPLLDKTKWLYSFEFKDPDGVFREFYIQKPGRMMRQQGEIEYAKQLAFFVKQGLLPKAAWNTILQNLGGTVSEPELKEYASLRANLWENEIKLNKLQLKSDKTEQEEKDKNQLVQDSFIIRENIQSFELNQIYIFENTAEAKARNQTVLWWLTKLSYIKEGDDMVVFFKGETLDDKLDYYDSLDSSTKEGEFAVRASKKLNYFVTLWFLNRISTYEDFAAVDVDKTIYDTGETEEPETSPEVPTEPTS